MTFLTLRGCAGALIVAGLIIASTAWAAEPKAQTGKSALPRSASKSGSGRGLLPDPVLLDGSTHPAEKKSEFGMIGDFELPGDDVRSDKVGGQQQVAGGQQQQQQNQQQGGGMPMGLPQAGSAGQQEANQQASAGGGAQGEQQNGIGQPIAGAGDPNAKPEGIQVAQLGGEASGEQPPGLGEKPPPVAIGDSAMRIQTPAATQGVVGAQQLPNQNTQHHEKGTGTGGRPPTLPQGPNRVEKGRTIPAGL